MSVASLAAATANSHRIAARADVYRDGALIEGDLPVTAGNVAVDAAAAIRRRCTLTLADPSGTLTPHTPADPLAPYGNEVHLYRGVAGDEAPLGVFRIEQASSSDAGSVTVQIAGYDRAGIVQEARFETPYVINSGQNYATEIQALILNRYPSATFSFASTSRTTPLLVFEEGADPWEQAQKMAANIGMELFFDPTGTCVLRPEPDPNDPAAAITTYSEGSNAVITSVTNNLSAKPAYNKFIVTGEPINGSAPVRAEAFDNNPASPTYYYGTFGKRPRFYRSQFITTTAQAQETADAFLLRELGGSEQLTFAAVPNPAHDVGDIVRVVRARLGVDVLAVIESLSMPLTPDAAMTVSTRRRRTSE